MVKARAFCTNTRSDKMTINLICKLKSPVSSYRQLLHPALHHKYGFVFYCGGTSVGNT